MNSLKEVLPFSFSPARFVLPDTNFKKRVVYCLLVFGIFMAALEFGQDYISSVLNGNPFHPEQSLSYKLFWLLFIPLSMLLVYALEKADSHFSRTAYIGINAFGVSIVSLIHLLLFALLLFGISALLFEEPWSLSLLITEKLSTRLYISLSIYIVFSFIYYFLVQNKGKNTAEHPGYSKNVTVKNGQSTLVIKTDDIKWIESDGPYLSIHVNGKRHVKLDSLKNIISTLPDNFKRIHRSTIVNIDKVQELNSRGNGDYDIWMRDGTKLRLSRNYAKPLKGLLL